MPSCKNAKPKSENYYYLLVQRGTLSTYNWPPKTWIFWQFYTPLHTLYLVQRVFEQRGLFQAQKTALFKAPLYF